MNELLNYLNNYTKNRKNKHRFSAVMVCLSVIVSFTVSIGLIEPAESLSGVLICGMEEHEHTRECYELICGFDDETAEEIVVESTECGSEETTESVYETEETVTSTKADETAEEIVVESTECGSEETTESVCETEETVTSTKADETAPVHIHSDECYRLVCLTEAHIHTQDCYSQPEQSTEHVMKSVLRGITPLSSQYTYNFTVNGTEGNTYYAISGGELQNKGSYKWVNTNYNNLSLTKGFALHGNNNSGKIVFTPPENGTLTIITAQDSNKSIKVNGTILLTHRDGVGKLVITNIQKDTNYTIEHGGNGVNVLYLEFTPPTTTTTITTTTTTTTTTVPSPQPIEPGNVRIEARVIFGDYKDDDNAEHEYNQLNPTPKFQLHYRDGSTTKEVGLPFSSELVPETIPAKKDWCYQYNYVWNVSPIDGNNRDKGYYVELVGYETGISADNIPTVKIGNSWYKVYYLRDDRLGHPGGNEDSGGAAGAEYPIHPEESYRNDSGAIYIYLDPLKDWQWGDVDTHPGTINLTMKKRWDGYNHSGFDNRQKEKIEIQLQRWNGNRWVRYDNKEGYYNWCYYEVTDGNGDKHFVNKSALNGTRDIYSIPNSKNYRDSNGNVITAERLKYENVRGKLDPSSRDDRIRLYLDESEWQDIVLTYDGANHPQHFKEGYYYGWNNLPYGQYRVIETQSFYDKNDNDKYDEGVDRDTSSEYYYMSFPPSRDSDGVLHIQNFTKDMVIEVQKEWYDEKGTNLIDNSKIPDEARKVKFEVYRCLGDPGDKVPAAPEKVGDFETNNSGYAFITSRARDTTDPQGEGYYYGVENMETKNSDTKYYYLIKEIVPEGYKLMNGDSDGFVLKSGSDNDYAIDYEDGDARKFIIKNKAKIGLKVEKEWYQDDNNVDYYNIEDKPIFPTFEVYKSDRPGTPMKDNTSASGYSVNGSPLRKITISEVKLGKDGHFELVSDNNYKSGDSSFVNPELNMFSSTKYELDADNGYITNTNSKIFETTDLSPEYAGNLAQETHNYYLKFDNDNDRLWVKPEVNGTLYLLFAGNTGEIEIYDKTGNIDVGKIGDYKINDYNGIISITGLKAGGNYRIRRINGNPCLLYASYTNDAYYYIREIPDANNRYTLSNGDENGFVEVNGGVYYTTITADNRYPVVTAKNTAEVKLNIAKKWRNSLNGTDISGITDKSMRFQIYTAYKNDTPILDQLKKYTGELKVGDTTISYNTAGDYYELTTDGELKITGLPAFEKGTDNKYHKLYYYVREIEGNYKLLNADASNGFIKNTQENFGSAFDDLNASSGHNYTFHNQPLISITVNKEWKNADGSPNLVPQEMKFALCRTIKDDFTPTLDDKVQEYAECVTVNQTWQSPKLPAYDDSGNKYNYYIMEIDGDYFVDNYNVTYDKSSVSWKKYDDPPVINVTNQAKPQNYELPETGGTGTHGYTVTGGVVVLLSGAALLLIRRKRGRKRNLI